MRRHASTGPSVAPAGPAPPPTPGRARRVPERPLPFDEGAVRDAQRQVDAWVLSELRARMTRSEAPSRLPCLRRRHFGDQCMPAPDEASSLLGQGDDLAAATASAQVLAELLKRRAEACR